MQKLLDKSVRHLTVNSHKILIFMEEVHINVMKRVNILMIVRVEDLMLEKNNKFYTI